jgi:hypothetical protein
MAKIVLPYEPSYVGGREAEKRRRHTQNWLRQREIEAVSVQSPPTVPAERAPPMETTKNEKAR